MKTKFMQIIFKDSVPTSKKTQSTSITDFSWLMLFSETIAIYSENHAEATIHSVGRMQNNRLLK